MSIASPMRAPADVRHGEPQFRSVPPSVDTAGHEAIDIVRSAGLYPDPWQERVLIDALGEREDGKWSALEVGLVVGRQNGKGTILEIRALAGLLTFGEKQQLWSAHETKTAFKAFRRMEDLINGCDDLRRRVKSINRSTGREGIRFNNGSELQFVARTKGSGRGFSADLIILDEAYALTEEQIDAMFPTLAARMNETPGGPQVWYTSSPPLDSVTGEKLFQLRARARAGARRLAWFDYGLQGVDLDDLSGVDMGDPALWRATNPAHGYRLTDEFIETEREALSEKGFARERLGIWPVEPTEGNLYVPVDLWRSLADRESVPDGSVTFAVDATPERDTAAIVAAGTRGDGLAHWEVIEHLPGLDWCVPRLVALRDRHDPVSVVVDSRGPAGSLVPDLVKAGFTVAARGDQPRKGDLVVAGGQDMATAFGMFVDACRQRQGRHIDQSPLTAALFGARTRPLGDGGEAWGRKGSADITSLVGATLAHWGQQTRAHLVTTEAFNIW